MSFPSFLFWFLALDCPPGWDEFDVSCYKVMTSFVYSQSLSWDNARAVCLGYGGDLVSIENEREMEFISLRYAEYMSYSIWIGLNDRIKHREYVWSDGTPFNGSVYSNWRDGEPNDWSGQEDCVELYNNGWNDLACSQNHYYMCKRPKGWIIAPLGKYSRKHWVGVCSPLSKTLILFETNICDFPTLFMT